MFIIYFGVALLSTIAGSMAGLGGGVIIKPVLDFLGDYNISTIGLLSSFTVFSMAFVSIIKQIMYKSKIDIKNTGALAIGSVLGGLIGSKFNRKFSNEVIIKVFNTVVAMIIALNIYNIITVL